MTKNNEVFSKSYAYAAEFNKAVSFNSTVMMKKKYNVFKFITVK